MSSGIVNVDIGSAIESVGNVFDNLFTSDEERLQAGLQSQTLETGLLSGQQKINEKSAGHKSVFVAGARPALLWVCAAGFAYQYILHPLCCWIFSLLQAFQKIPYHTVVVIDGVSKAIPITPPPALDLDQLLSLALGMLGLGGMRMYEGIKGVKTNSIKEAQTQETKSGGWFSWFKK